MADPKAVLESELNNLHALQLRLKGLPLDSADLELLDELVASHARVVQSTWLSERVQLIVDLLFPSYNGRLDEADKPIRWPAKAWWWNGAAIKELDEQANGDVVVTVRSYVGGGETDTLKDFSISKSWLEAPDLATAIHQACLEEKARLKGTQRAKDLAAAHRDAAAASARIAELTGGRHA